MAGRSLLITATDEVGTALPCLTNLLVPADKVAAAGASLQYVLQCPFVVLQQLGSQGSPVIGRSTPADFFGDLDARLQSDNHLGFPGLRQDGTQLRLDLQISAVHAACPAPALRPSQQRTWPQQQPRPAARRP